MNINNIEYNYSFVPSCGYLLGELTETQLQPIWDVVNKIDFNSSKSHSRQLAGHLKNQYELDECKNYVNDLFEPLIWEYDKLHNHSFFKTHYNILSEGLPCTLNDIWVNFQQKHEFNPIHNHSGVMSFVLWLNIPYNIEDELVVFPDPIHISTGCFNFHTIGSLGNIIQTTLPVDKTWNGKFVLFPSGMMHSVNPFYTSDDYRITVSGNFKLKP
jgi:hypothetical protein